MLLKEYNYLCKFNSIDKEKLKMACQQFPPSYLLSVRQQISVRDLSVCLVKFNILIRPELAQRQREYYELLKYFNPSFLLWTD